MTISNSCFSHLTRAFALSLCTALLLNFVSCSDSSTSQDPKVKIIFDANGGSFSETTGKTETTYTLLIKKNQTSKLSTADELGLSRENHNFTGWAKSQQGTVEYNDGADITSSTDLTLYAQWEAVNSTYTVKHLLQNLADDSYTEDEEATEQKTGTYGTQTAAVAKTYEGYTVQTFEQKTIQADGLTVVEIKYDRNTYTISYNSTYGEPPVSKTVRYGYQLTAADLPDLTQTNYSFKGWLIDGGSIPAGYTVKTDITLTALWDEIIANYTVKHLLQNLADNDYTEDEEAAEPKSGKSGTQTAAAAKSYEGFTPKSFTQATIQADGSTVVEIKYDRNTYTISYSSEYGDAPASKPVKYEYVLTAADLPELTQTNYSFKGWLFDGASIEAEYIVKKDINLTAQWDEIIANYTVKHLLQNLQDDNYTEKAAEQKSGKSGTKTSATAKSYEGFTAKSFAQATIQADGSTVVEIYYDRKTYTISYSSTCGEPPVSKTVKYGYILTTADLPDLTQTNYSFKGWRIGGASIVAGYIVKKDITLTAQWVEIIATYTVKHLLQNLQDDSYTEDSTEQKSGKSGTQTAADAKTYEGFTAKSFTQKTIQADGSTVVEICYNRKTYTLSYSSTYGDAPVSKTVKYGYVTTAADLPDLTQTNYSFYGWLIDGASIAAGYIVKKDITLTALWEVAASTYFVTKENFSAVIAALTEDSTIVLTGELSDSDLTAIATAIKNSSYKVNLDLSQTTELTSIPASPFMHCSKLLGITIPDSVTSIGDYAFYGCTALSSVTIPDSVTSIGEEAFRSCTSLSSVTIPDSVTSIGQSAFSGCSSLSSVTIPDSVTSIGSYAFYECTSLSSVTIPDSVTSIGQSTFSGCTSLTTIIVDSNNANYSSIDGVLFNKDETTLITYPKGKQSAAYTIPDSVTSIGNYAFYYSTSLSSVTIPDSVTSIGSNAFTGCSSLSSVTIPDSVTSIGRYAFRECRRISSATIPDSVTSIEGYVFYCCKSLSSVTIPDSVTSIGSNAFYGCKSLSSVTIPNSVTYIGSLAFEGCSSLSSVTIGNSVTSINAQAFCSCTALSSVTIPDSVTSIGSNAFTGCTSLSSVTISDSVTSIGDSAFYNCTSLSSVIIPDSVTSIGYHAFYGCTSLSSTTIGNSVTSIRNYAFEGCSKLTSLNFKDPTTWYRTDSYTNWNNKTGGTLTDVSDAAANATYFKDTYTGYYWYKLDE